MARFMPDGWALPALDPLTKEFFTSGRIAIQACKACSALQHPPEEVCYACGGMELGLRESCGTGTVYSYTIVDYPVHPALRERVPYAVVLVSLDDLSGVRVVGNLLDVAPDDIRIGLPVRAVFEEIDAGDGQRILLPQWRADATRR